MIYDYEVLIQNVTSRREDITYKLGTKSNVHGHCGQRKGQSKADNPAINVVEAEKNSKQGKIK